MQNPAGPLYDTKRLSLYGARTGGRPLTMSFWKGGAMAKTELLYPKNWGAKEAMDSTLNEYLAPRAIEKKLKFWGLELKVI